MIDLRRILVVPDELEDIATAVRDYSQRFDVVFTSGGVGPTHDDITAECVAKAFGVPLIQDPEAVRRLRAHYANPADLNPLPRAEEAKKEIDYMGGAAAVLAGRGLKATGDRA